MTRQHSVNPQHGTWPRALVVEAPAYTVRHHRRSYRPQLDQQLFQGESDLDGEARRAWSPEQKPPNAPA